MEVENCNFSRLIACRDMQKMQENWEIRQMRLLLHMLSTMLFIPNIFLGLPIMPEIIKTLVLKNIYFNNNDRIRSFILEKNWPKSRSKNPTYFSKNGSRSRSKIGKGLQRVLWVQSHDSSQNERFPKKDKNRNVKIKKIR